MGEGSAASFIATPPSELLLLHQVSDPGRGIGGINVHRALAAQPRESAIGGVDFGELSLRNRAQLEEECAAGAYQPLDFCLHGAHFRSRGLDDLLAFRLCLTNDELCFTVRLFADVATQLLGGDQGFIERLVSLAERPELLM